MYRHFGETVAAGTSPLYERVAVALSESDQALRAIEADGYRSLQDNQRVEYTVTQGAKGPQAEKVHAI